MRHSAASYHLAAHHNESLTQAMLGHESGKMLIQHYRELVKPREAALLGTRAAPGEQDCQHRGRLSSRWRKLFLVANSGNLWRIEAH